MKKIVLFCMALCLGATNAFSQNSYFEGNVGVSYNNANDNVAFSINPNLGFMVSEDWSVGFGFYGTYSEDSSIGGSEYGGIIFAQNYTKITDRFYCTPKTILRIGGGDIDMEHSLNSTSYSYSFFGFGIGLALLNFEFRATPKIGVTLDMGGFDFTYAKPQGVNKGNFQIDLSAFQKNQIGMKFYF